jgi:integrase
VAHVEDRWEKIADGQRMRTARYGAGNRWRARYVDADGRERSRTFARKGDAERFLVATEADLLRGSYVDPQRAKLTLGAYAERWLAAQPLRPSSRRTYEIYLRTRILPALGARGLGSITPTDVRGLVRSLQQDLASITVHHIHGLLATILRAAMEDGYLARNPCARTAPGKGARARVVPMTTAQVQAVLEALPVRYRITALLGAGCGLRIGEVLGLRVRSVDFLAGELAVVEQLQLLPGAPPYLAPPKTTSSVRVVPMPLVVADALAEHLLREPGAPHELVLRSSTGGPVWPNTFNTSIWRPAVRRAGLTTTRFHDLRHFYATALIRSGESVKTVQAALGHASAVETLETYTGLWPDAEQRTRDAVDRLGLGDGLGLGDRLTGGQVPSATPLPLDRDGPVTARPDDARVEGAADLPGGPLEP